MKLSELTTSLIKEKQTQLSLGTTVRGKRRSPARVNRYLAVLSSALSTAVREWEWLDENPCSKVRSLTEPQGRVRFLSDEEREKLIEACRNSHNTDLLLVFLISVSSFFVGLVTLVTSVFSFPSSFLPSQNISLYLTCSKSVFCLTFTLLFVFFLVLVLY